MSYSHSSTMLMKEQELGSSRLMKKGVEAALRRHTALNSLEIWRGKPAATSRRTTFSSASEESGEQGTGNR